MGYLSVPASGAGPGVVVIQEIFGVNAVMRGVTDWLAGEGYMALCPDLFWRQEPGIQLSDQSPEDWERAFELFGGFDLEAGIKDLDATVEALRGTDGCLGKVGAIGYCMGGGFALEQARAGANFKATVVFHVTAPNPVNPGAATDFKGRVLALHGSTDPVTPKPMMDALEEELTGAEVDWQIMMFGRGTHSFCVHGANNPPVQVYNEELCQQSYRMMRDFFAKTF